MTGIHQDTICRLGVRVGNAGARVMDEQMRGLTCKTIQMDEIWGFIGKKQKNLRKGDEARGLGDVWTFVSIDAETRMVPNYFVGKRDSYSANTFVSDLAERIDSERVQISTDALAAYVDAIERGFGSDADYGQIVKTFGNADIEGQRRYSPAEIVRIRKGVVSGRPEWKHISTSYIERQNLTMRMHMRRLTRLTNAFSKKLENFKAAVGLHFAYYNFVRFHKTLRMTPAMAGGVTNHAWTIRDLVEAAQ
ncbi:MAG: IS1 family transposase [Chthoniobacter sp.]|uniref:IS1 family transposase n=1 Tax=Chthoniobacter sp. TaxID=2510640 RepID=UPI0032A33981